MTPEQLKQLAEWSAEFLGGEYNSFNWLMGNKFGTYLTENTLFIDECYAPILMHLGKREMEKRGFTWKIEVHQKKYRVKVDRPSIHYQKTQISTNEYIAFWTAVREALK